MDRIFIIDFETTGLDPKMHQVIECAGIVYSLKYKTIISQLSFLCPVTENKAEKINKINKLAACSNNFIPISHANELIKSCEAVVAHNAQFDKEWHLHANLYEATGKPWICTLYDVDWPEKPASGMSLVNLALTYKVPVVSAHRALTDCQLIAEIFNREPNIDKLLEDAKQPKELYIAKVNYEERHFVKDEGFVWDSLIPKAWAKRLTEEQAVKLIDKYKNIIEFIKN